MEIMAGLSFCWVPRETNVAAHIFASGLCKMFLLALLIFAKCYQERGIDCVLILCAFFNKKN